MIHTSAQLDPHGGELRLERLLDRFDAVMAGLGQCLWRVIKVGTANVFAHHGPFAGMVLAQGDAPHEVETYKDERFISPHNDREIDQFIEKLLLDEIT